MIILLLGSIEKLINKDKRNIILYRKDNLRKT